jgi:putative solute:sodium symporter small subunit
MDNETQPQRHWRRSRTLTFLLLAVWFVATYVMAFYARELSAIRFFGWPLSFYMAAQGTLVVYLVLIGVYARRMRRIDQECGVAEEVDS